MCQDVSLQATSREKGHYNCQESSRKKDGEVGKVSSTVHTSDQWTIGMYIDVGFEAEYSIRYQLSIESTLCHYSRASIFTNHDMEVGSGCRIDVESRMRRID